MVANKQQKNNLALELAAGGISNGIASTLFNFSDVCKVKDVVVSFLDRLQTHVVTYTSTSLPSMQGETSNSTF